MSKKTRHKTVPQHGARSTSQRIARINPAPYASWADMLPRAPGQLDQERTPHRGTARRITRLAAVTQPQSARKGRVTPFSAFFATPPLPHLQQRLQGAFSCARRHARREVLFATRRTGKGSGAPKKHFTNKRC